MNKVVNYYYLCLFSLLLLQAFSTIFTNNQQLSRRLAISQLEERRQTLSKDIRDFRNQTALNQSLLAQTSPSIHPEDSVFHDITRQFIIDNTSSSLLGSL